MVRIFNNQNMAALSNTIERPIPGYHFRVDFGLEGYFEKDVAFKNISGVSFKVIERAESVGAEIGGKVYSIENSEYTPLVLERGMFKGSKLIDWMTSQCQTKKKIPIPIVVSVLDAKAIPINSWFFINAYPIAWETSGFSSEKSQLLVEKITFRYLYYKQVDMSGWSIKQELAKLKTA